MHICDKGGEDPNNGDLLLATTWALTQPCLQVHVKTHYTGEKGDTTNEELAVLSHNNDRAEISGEGGTKPH